MRRGFSASAVYVVACALLAAVLGRLVDQSAGLPGVHETSAVRAGAAAWVVCLVSAGALGIVAASRWSLTRSIRNAAGVVVPGQLCVFLAGEAVVRVWSGQGPFDADALVGGALQGVLALLLLLALAVVGIALLRCRPIPAVSVPVAVRLRVSADRRLRSAAGPRLRSARAPPRPVLP